MELFFSKFLIYPELLLLKKGIQNSIRTINRCPENYRTIPFDSKPKRFPMRPNQLVR